MALYTQTIKEIVDSSTPIFDFEYEFYDPTNKADFEQKFVNHFMYREIGIETVAQFKHYLKCKFDETLPYYNMLFRTALIDYEKTVNYNLSDTYTREVNKLDSSLLDSTAKKVSAVTATNELDTTNTDNREETQVAEVDATSDHSENNTVNKAETESQSQSTNNSSLSTVNDRIVESDTPSGLLSLGEIVDDVYATKATIGKKTDSLSGSNDTDGSRKLDVEDLENRTATNESSSKATENLTSTVNGVVHSATNGTQNEDTENVATVSSVADGKETETSTRVMRGSYGVITEADMLKKHIELQQTLATIHKKFFEECNDLFMQIF